MSIFSKFATATALCATLANCSDNSGLAYMDSGAATAAGAALGYGIGKSLDKNNGGYVGAALGTALANAAINNAQRCQTYDNVNRSARRDNRTGRIVYDETSQTSSSHCRTVGSGHAAGPQQPIF